LDRQPFRQRRPVRIHPPQGNRRAAVEEIEILAAIRTGGGKGLDRLPLAIALLSFDRCSQEFFVAAEEMPEWFGINISREQENFLLVEGIGKFIE
jgi:hypothetical protein